MGFARSSARNGAVHLDGVTLALVGAIALLGLVMVTSASVSIAGQESGQPFFYLERQLLLTLIGAACAALVFSVPTELLEQAVAAAAGDRDRAAAGGAGARARALGERQPALAAAGRRELPGVRARPRAGADLRRQLRGAARERAARLVQGLVKPLGAGVLRERAAAGGAGLRRRHRAVRDRLRPAVPRRGAAALRHRHDRHRRGVLWRCWR